MRAGSSIETRSRLERLYSGCARTLIYAGVFSFVVNLLMLTGPIYMLQVYDRVLMSGSVPTLVALTLLALGLFCTLGLVEWVRRALFSTTASQVEEALADDIMTASVDAKLADAGTNPRQPLKDLRTLRRFLSGSALPALFDVPWIPLFFLALFLMHWMYGLLGLAGAAILLGLAIVNQRVSQRTLSGAAGQSRTVDLIAEEMTDNAETMTALGMRQDLQARWRQQLDSADLNTSIANRMLSGFSSGTRASRLFLQSSILGLGAWLSIIGHSTPGAMIAASIILSRAVAPIDQIVGQWRSIIDAFGAWRSLSELLNSLEDSVQRISLPPIQGTVKVNNATVYKKGLDEPLLDAIAFEVNAGETVGVIGPSASGKSTLARILTGIWQPTRGDVTIDGARLESWSSNELGKQIGYIAQDPQLFYGSVKENISRYSNEATSEAVIAAAKSAGCHEMILALNDGYETEIGRGAAYLSGGQKQLIGLARALYGEPNLVVLDEPNSNLDANGDHALRQALIALKKRRATTIIVSHRPGILQVCDKILVLDQGSVSLFGDRQTVLAKISEAAKSTRVTPLRKGKDSV